MEQQRRPTRDEVLAWLREEDEARLKELWAAADRVRAANVGDEVHLRGLVEISNHCVRQCGYCGLRAGNRGIERYRMRADEILGCARDAVRFGYGTVVMQAGEDPALTREWVADLVRAIKRETGLAVTLSLGERSEADLVAWREAGANRYLLRFETSDRALFERIHPSLAGRSVDRVEQLRQMRRLGYEIGSGIMVGIPGQSWASVADDLMLFAELDLDMIGIGPYLPHPATPLGQTHASTNGGAVTRSAPETGARSPEPPSTGEQIPNSELMVLKAVALTRLLCPEANIPSTTALATLDKARGRELGLMRGANIVMPNLTPPEYRVKYEIYPDKACVNETAQQCAGCLELRIRSIGRRIGTGAGGRRRRLP